MKKNKEKKQATSEKAKLVFMGSYENKELNIDIQ